MLQNIAGTIFAHTHTHTHTHIHTHNNWFYKYIHIDILQIRTSATFYHYVVSVWKLVGIESVVCGGLPASGGKTSATDTIKV